MILPSLIFFALITTGAPILGKYIAWVFHYGFSEHEALKGNRGYWKSQNWKEYFSSLMSFNIICILCTFIIIYFQQYFPTYYENVQTLFLSLIHTQHTHTHIFMCVQLKYFHTTVHDKNLTIFDPHYIRFNNFISI